MSSFDRISIIPAPVSNIEHRSECVPYYDAFWSDEQGGWCLSGAHLPLFTAPMACIINEYNYLTFDNAGINVIVPRNVSYNKRLQIMEQMIWVAMGLDEFDEFIKTHDSLPEERYICVDVANGHMKKLIDMCHTAKLKFGENLILMAGNIANSETYREYAKAGIDYCRCCIGTGNACTTAVLTGVFCDPLQLIKECAAIKNAITDLWMHDDDCPYLTIPKIVMDGGMNHIDHIIKALAVGADYVMCGKIFAACEEACGIIEYRKVGNSGPIPYRQYYGMSTQRAQMEMGNKRLKSAEGLEKLIPIEYKLEDWVKQFDAAICSTMSYCNAVSLYDFIGKVKIAQLPREAYLGYKK